MTTSLKQIIPLSLALLVLLGYQFIGASTWNPAPSSPPNSNAPAPINVGVNSASDQEMKGTLRMHNVYATNTMNSKVALYDDALAVGVYNTSVSPSALTAWRVRRNDGTGNFLTYINTAGGNSPTYETNGHAYKERYYVGNGEYTFLTADSGTTGSNITWVPSFKILPGGKVGAGEYCDLNGNNCTILDSTTGAGDVIVGTVINTNADTRTPLSAAIEFTTPFDSIPEIIPIHIDWDSYTSYENEGDEGSPVTITGVTKNGFTITLDGTTGGESVWVNSVTWMAVANMSGKFTQDGFSWLISSWNYTYGTCPAGQYGSPWTATRTVVCKNSSNITVAGSNCPQPKPPTVSSGGEACHREP